MATLAALHSVAQHVVIGATGRAAVAAGAALLGGIRGMKAGAPLMGRAPARLQSRGLAAQLPYLLVLVMFLVVAPRPIMIVLLMLVAAFHLVHLVLRASPYLRSLLPHSFLHPLKFKLSMPVGQGAPYTGIRWCAAGAGDLYS